MTDDEHDYYSVTLRVRIPAVPRERPAFLRLWATDSGRLWVWPGATGSSREATDQEREFMRQALPGVATPTRIWSYWLPTDGFDVFGSDGQWIGHVDTPDNWDGDPYPGIGDPQFKGDTIWAVTRDEFDVSYISKFVVDWPTLD